MLQENAFGVPATKQEIISVNKLHDVTQHSLRVLAVAGSDNDGLGLARRNGCLHKFPTSLKMSSDMHPNLKRAFIFHSDSTKSTPGITTILPQGSSPK